MLIKDLTDLGYIKYTFDEDEIMLIIIKELVLSVNEDENKLIDIYNSLCNYLYYKDKKNILDYGTYDYISYLIAYYSSDYDNNKTNEENLYHKMYYNTGNEGVIAEWVRDYLESKDIFFAYMKEEDEQI